jgi:hypothetical protein
MLSNPFTHGPGVYYYYVPGTCLEVRVKVGHDVQLGPHVALWRH